MTIQRAVNFGVFLLACVGLVVVYCMWKMSYYPVRTMGLYAGVCLCVIVVTIINEGRMVAAKKCRGFDLQLDYELARASASHSASFPGPYTNAKS